MPGCTLRNDVQNHPEISPSARFAPYLHAFERSVLTESELSSLLKHGLKACARRAGCAMVCLVVAGDGEHVIIIPESRAGELVDRQVLLRVNL